MFISASTSFITHIHTGTHRRTQGETDAHMENLYIKVGQAHQEMKNKSIFEALSGIFKETMRVNPKIQTTKS